MQGAPRWPHELAWLAAVGAAYCGLVVGRPSGWTALVVSISVAGFALAANRAVSPRSPGRSLATHRALLAVLAAYVAVVSGRWLIQLAVDWAWPALESEGQAHHVLRVLDFRLLVIVAVSGPIIEEALFRGILYDVICVRQGTATAVLLTSFVFAAVHWLALRDIGVVAPVLWLGIVLGSLRAWGGAIGLPIGLHVLNNLASELVALAG